MVCVDDEFRVGVAGKENRFSDLAMRGEERIGCGQRRGKRPKMAEPEPDMEA